MLYVFVILIMTHDKRQHNAVQNNGNGNNSRTEKEQFALENYAISIQMNKSNCKYKVISSVQ